MQEALPYRTWPPAPQDPPLLRSSSPTNRSIAGAIDEVKNMVLENSVIVFGLRGCCMSHVVKRLLQGLGVNPAVYEINEEDEDSVVNELQTISGGSREGGRWQFPAVFIGGQLFGGLDRVMATHITGELTPILKQAGALWL